MDGPVIIVLRVSSLDDAIDVCNGQISKLAPSRPDGLSASFIFAAPREASYLSNFINANLSCINHIPAELMIGPVCPSNHPVTSASVPRYTTSMFSDPSPQLLHPTPLTTLFLSNQSLQKTNVGEWKKWQEDAAAPLPPTRQHNGQMVDFFDQAIFVSLAAMIVGLVGAGASGWWLIRRGRV